MGQAFCAHFRRTDQENGADGTWRLEERHNFSLAISTSPMTGSTTERFNELFVKLPLRVRKRVRWCLLVWASDPSHPSLFFKKPFENKPFWSMRITKGYRAIGYLKGNQMFWFWVGNHDHYERLMSHL